MFEENDLRKGIIIVKNTLKLLDYLEENDLSTIDNENNTIGNEITEKINEIEKEINQTEMYLFR